MQPTQNYDNHRRLSPIYHFVTQPILLLAMIGAVTHFVLSLGGEGGFRTILPAASLLLLSIGAMLASIIMRINDLRIQDRLIQTEVALRYQRATGRSLEELPITDRQKIALRFAGDDELGALAERAAKENLTPDAIKRAIKNWKADNRRV